MHKVKTAFSQHAHVHCMLGASMTSHNVGGVAPCQAAPKPTVLANLGEQKRGTNASTESACHLGLGESRGMLPGN